MAPPSGLLEHGPAFARLMARWGDADAGLLDAIPRVSPRYEPPVHLAPVVELLERSRREPVRGLVSVPPRHGKTELIAHGLAWLLSRDPRRTHAYVTYAAQVAYSKSRSIRDYARTLGVPIRPDAEALHEWRTPERGGLLATGIGGPLTGHGVDGVLVVDDPTKNREEAESAVLREKNHGWFTSVAMTRVEPRGSVIVVHTRWHEDDLIGRLAGEADWEYVNLPAIAPDGAALWPSRWPVEELAKKRRASRPPTSPASMGCRPGSRRRRHRARRLEARGRAAGRASTRPRRTPTSRPSASCASSSATAPPAMGGRPAGTPLSASGAVAPRSTPPSTGRPTSSSTAASVTRPS